MPSMYGFPRGAVGVVVAALARARQPLSGGLRPSAANSAS
jgi:hypothetical protein